MVLLRAREVGCSSAYERGGRLWCCCGHERWAAVVPMSAEAGCGARALHSRGSAML